MKILFVLADSIKSGANLSATTLAKIINEKENTQTIVVLAEHGPIEKTLQKYNIKYFFVRSWHWTTLNGQNRTILFKIKKS